MEIETFELEEQVVTPEVEIAAIELIDRLDLRGQRSLVKKVDGDEERMPYPEMSRTEIAVYEAIFPEKTRLKDYAYGLIPIRILQVAAHGEKHFADLFVWSKKMRDPDPILVGKQGDKLYLMARWGDALKHFKDLVVEAREILMIDYRKQLEEKIRDGNAKLTGLASLVEEKLSGGFVWI